MCYILVVRIEVTVYFVVTKKKCTPFSHTEWAQQLVKRYYNHFSTNKHIQTATKNTRQFKRIAFVTSLETPFFIVAQEQVSI